MSAHVVDPLYFSFPDVSAGLGWEDCSVCRVLALLERTTGFHLLASKLFISISGRWRMRGGKAAYVYLCRGGSLISIYTQ